MNIVSPTQQTARWIDSLAPILVYQRGPERASLDSDAERYKILLDLLITSQRALPLSYMGHHREHYMLMLPHKVLSQTL